MLFQILPVCVLFSKKVDWAENLWFMLAKLREREQRTRIIMNDKVFLFILIFHLFLYPSQEVTHWIFQWNPEYIREHFPLKLRSTRPFCSILTKSFWLFTHSWTFIFGCSLSCSAGAFILSINHSIFHSRRALTRFLSRREVSEVNFENSPYGFGLIIFQYYVFAP